MKSGTDLFLWNLFFNIQTKQMSFFLAHGFSWGEFRMRWFEFLDKKHAYGHPYLWFMIYLFKLFFGVRGGGGIWRSLVSMYEEKLKMEEGMKGLQMFIFFGWVVPSGKINNNIQQSLDLVANKFEGIKQEQLNILKKNKNNLTKKEWIWNPVI